MGLGEHHMSLLVRAKSLDALDPAVAQSLAALADLGTIAVREDINLEAAFWAQFPGNEPYIARKALISTAAYASLCFAAQFPDRPAGRQSLGAGGHRVRDLVGHALLFQLPPGRSRQFHRHRPVGFGQDGGAQLPAGAGAEVQAAHRLLRQGSRRRALHPRHRRPLRHAAARRADRLQSAAIAG